MGEIKKEKSKIGIIIAIIIIALVLIVGAIGGYYVIKRNYIVSKINQTNLIIKNSNATSSLKNNVYIKDGVVYVSKPDIYNFFDNTITYDELSSVDSWNDIKLRYLTQTLYNNLILWETVSNAIINSTEYTSYSDLIKILSPNTGCKFCPKIKYKVYTLIVIV